MSQAGLNGLNDSLPASIEKLYFHYPTGEALNYITGSTTTQQHERMLHNPSLPGEFISDNTGQIAAIIIQGSATNPPDRLLACKSYFDIPGFTKERSWSLKQDGNRLVSIIPLEDADSSCIRLKIGEEDLSLSQFVQNTKNFVTIYRRGQPGVSPEGRGGFLVPPDNNGQKTDSISIIGSTGYSPHDDNNPDLKRRPGGGLLMPLKSVTAFISLMPIYEVSLKMKGLQKTLVPCLTIRVSDNSLWEEPYEYQVDWETFLHWFSGYFDQEQLKELYDSMQGLSLTLMGNRLMLNSQSYFSSLVEDMLKQSGCLDKVAGIISCPLNKSDGGHSSPPAASSPTPSMGQSAPSYSPPSRSGVGGSGEGSGGSGRGGFICKYCSRDFPTRIQLKSHESGHEAKQSSSMAATPMAIPINGDLMKQMRVHEKRRKYQNLIRDMTQKTQGQPIEWSYLYSIISGTMDISEDKFIEIVKDKTDEKALEELGNNAEAIFEDIDTGYDILFRIITSPDLVPYESGCDATRKIMRQWRDVATNNLDFRSSLQQVPTRETSINSGNDEELSLLLNDFAQDFFRENSAIIISSDQDFAQTIIEVLYDELKKINPVVFGNSNFLTYYLDDKSFRGALYPEFQRAISMGFSLETLYLGASSGGITEGSFLLALHRTLLGEHEEFTKTLFRDLKIHILKLRRAAVQDHDSINKFEAKALIWILRAIDFNHILEPGSQSITSPVPVPAFSSESDDSNMQAYNNFTLMTSELTDHISHNLNSWAEELKAEGFITEEVYRIVHDRLTRSTALERANEVVQSLSKTVKAAPEPTLKFITQKLKRENTVISRQLYASFKLQMDNEAPLQLFYNNAPRLDIREIFDTYSLVREGILSRDAHDLIKSKRSDLYDELKNSLNAKPNDKEKYDMLAKLFSALKRARINHRIPYDTLIRHVQRNARKQLF